MVTVVHAPKNEMPRIDCIWAFLSVDEEDGNEGVCAAQLAGMPGLTPLIAADQRRLDLLTPIAEDLARQTGRVLRLVKFHNREVVRQIGGQ
jgi:hypothetical protein